MYVEYAGCLLDIKLDFGAGRHVERDAPALLTQFERHGDSLC
jgi:hypothetical protein